MDYTILNELGLSEREVSVYVALLELGECSAGEVRKQTRLQNSTIHHSLNQLIQKGLVSFVEKGKRRHYQAADPHQFLSKLDAQRRKMEELLPKLLQKQHADRDYEVHIFEGMRGIKTVHEDILRDLANGEEFFVLGAPKRAHDEFEPYFLDFHRRRKHRGIQLRAIYDPEAAKYAEVRKTMPDTKVRYLPGSRTPVWLTTYKEKTIIIVVGDLMLAIVVQNQSIAEDFQQHFRTVWKLASKTVQSVE